MNYDDLRKIDGWAKALGPENRETPVFHYFHGPQSACEKYRRPEFAHPREGEMRESCRRCWDWWARNVRHEVRLIPAERRTPAEIEEWGTVEI